MANVPKNGPKRDSKSYQIGLIIARKALAHELMLSSDIARDLGMPDTYKNKITEVLTQKFKGLFNSSGGIITFADNDNGSRFLAHLKELKGEITEFENRRDGEF